MSNDWQNALQSLLSSGSLPEGEAPAAEEPVADSRKKNGGARLVISMEKKGRGGKTVTIISGFSGSQDELQELAATLKSRLGTGGSARGGEILIQGDRREDVRRMLTAMGYRC